MGDYHDDRYWADYKIPESIWIFAPYLINKSDFELQVIAPYLFKRSSYKLDTKNATDVVLSFGDRDVNIAIRNRNYHAEYNEKNKNEITIRSRRSSGAETELSKIMKGFGDYMFYSRDNEHGQIDIWHLISLHKFRDAINGPYGHRIIPSKEDNGDGTLFHGYELDFFPPDSSIVIASSHNFENRWEQRWGKNWRKKHARKLSA